MAPPDSSLIDAAIIAKLVSDATLMGLMTDGVFVDAAKPGATKFVIVSLIDEEDVGELQQRAYEDALYLVKAVSLNSSGTDVKSAAARIDVLLEDQPLEPSGSPSDIPGYSWMTTHRESRVRYTEVDEVDASKRWQHRGGRYRVQMAVDQIS